MEEDFNKILDHFFEQIIRKTFVLKLLEVVQEFLGGCNCNYCFGLILLLFFSFLSVLN
jgi:hypothetical protein